ncbi:hypothetical protein GGQ99_002172 [Aminobacter niigataensis]|uniref:Uncharacterized protein n=1 Tax=Aminobacter niigataensis TaxID=83265 RepID=A0ABR6L0U0_9HYPH|nr:hypothetical protein [Aminobacter niigataensis]
MPSIGKLCRTVLAAGGFKGAFMVMDLYFIDFRTEV